MRHLSKTLLAAAAAATISSPASAVDIDFTGFAFGSSDVTFVLNADAARTVSAGAFSGLIGSQSFVFYCIDLLQTINFGDGAYAYTGPFSSVSPALFNTNLGKLFTQVGSVDTAVESAAFQLAVWELAYETSGTYDVAAAAGSIEFTGNASVLTQAQSYLNNLAAISGSTPFAAYQSAQYQDVVTPVPEPETYALMAAGLGALGWVSRRRKAQAKA